MNVLIVSQYYWPESFRITEVAQSLREAGAEVTVLTGKPNYPDGRIFDGYSAWGTVREVHDGIPVFRVPLAPRGAGGGVRLALNYLSFVVAGSLFGPWLLRRRHVDVILVYGISPILQGIVAIALKRVKRAPVALWVQDLWPQSLSATGFVRNDLVLKTVEWLVRAIYRRSDRLLVQSPAFVEPVAALGARVRIRYHPNPGERALDLPTAVQAESPVRFDPNAFNVVFAGNLGAAQSVDTIVDAAARLVDRPRIRFVLVGSGSRSDWIRGEIERRGLTNIEVPGRFPADAMPAILQRASLLLVTLAREDIFALTVPSKVQAYLAAGKPILAAMDGEGARVITEAGAGIAVPAEDPAALADAVLRLSVLPPEDLARIGQAGRTYYDSHFAPALLARRLLDLLQEVAEGWGRTGGRR